VQITVRGCLPSCSYVTRPTCCVQLPLVRLPRDGTLKLRHSAELQEVLKFLVNRFFDSRSLEGLLPSSTPYFIFHPFSSSFESIVKPVDTPHLYSLLAAAFCYCPYCLGYRRITPSQLLSTLFKIFCKSLQIWGHHHGHLVTRLPLRGGGAQSQWPRFSSHGQTVVLLFYASGKTSRRSFVKLIANYRRL
jgi:hypothetical protein